MIQIITIEAKSARAFTLHAGQVIRIIDVVGGQAGDLVAFNAHDLTEVFSPARTRVEERTCRVTTGARLWTNVLPPRVLLTVVEDTAGGLHDLLYLPCCRYALETRFQCVEDGCHEHLMAALAPWSIDRLPEPLNLFFHVRVDEEGAISFGDPPSCAGNTIALRAEIDCLVAISTCPVPHPGRECSGYRVEISG